MTSAISIAGLTKRFPGDVLALENVDLEVHEGEIFGFLGPNGAGKSTTINVLLDFVRPTSGTVSVLGMNPQREGVALRQRVGVLPDGFHVYDRLTGRQHVQFAVDSKRVDEDVDALLDRVDILDAADRKAGGYSKGMKQRLVLAMALVGDPDILVLDEPTTGLDPNGAREIREIIREEAARGATVFFSSHILEQVEAVCDRVCILDDGRVVAVDTIENLRESVDADARMTVELDAVPTPAVLDAVEAVAGVTAVTASDSTLTVACDPGVKTRVLDAIEAQGVDVRDFATDRTSLEDLFMTYTSHDTDDELTAGSETDRAAADAPTTDATTTDGSEDDAETDAAEPSEVSR
ncbi:ABC transporter ATP-binding protein [Halorubellus sp. PRR65]|uniref:ABC transporter ATP-binding protein n=1 Tax=Halorubellus sp. PRR65 TaxID=3098148 RepID=UPI002B25F16A|nr:ABC transporter ATP-binding protein [Halorubellus sp. PRR65]